jgi:hypothetical protein
LGVRTTEGARGAPETASAPPGKSENSANSGEEARHP